MTLSDILSFLNGKFVSSLGMLSSIAGFILSAFVLLTVRKIRKFYIFTARVPQVNQKLVEIASSISDHLNTFDGYTTKTYEILANAEINLKSLSRKVDGSFKKEVDKLIKTIGSINKRYHPIIQSIINYFNPPSIKNGASEKESLERIYVSLYKVTNECNARYEDARWER